MKSLVLAFLIAVGNASGADAGRLANIQSELGELTSIDGKAVGYAGIPGRFYLLYPYFVTYGAEQQFDRMLGDANPIVSAMGAFCLLERAPKRRDEILGKMATDQRKVSVFPFGCVGTEMTLAALFAEVSKTPDFIIARQFAPKGPAASK